MKGEYSFNKVLFNKKKSFLINHTACEVKFCVVTAVENMSNSQLS